MGFYPTLQVRPLDKNLCGSPELGALRSTIHDTKTQIKSLEEPMELTSTCASWRKQRAAREHINDPVTTTLQEVGGGTTAEERSLTFLMSLMSCACCFQDRSALKVQGTHCSGVNQGCGDKLCCFGFFS